MDFADFQQAVHAQFGAEAAAVRHEIYFLTRRRGAGLRAALAVLRDAWLCLRLPQRPPVLSGGRRWQPCRAATAGAPWRRTWPICSDRVRHARC